LALAFKSPAVKGWKGIFEHYIKSK
jgi:hypothetical protein